MIIFDRITLDPSGKNELASIRNTGIRVMEIVARLAIPR